MVVFHNAPKTHIYLKSTGRTVLLLNQEIPNVLKTYWTHGTFYTIPPKCPTNTGRTVILFICVTFPFSELFLQHLMLYNNRANEIFLAKNCRHFHFGAFLGTFNAR